MSSTRVVLGALALLAVALPAAGAERDPLAALRWKARVLVVIAPDASDAALAEQGRLFRIASAGAHERDLVLLEGIGRDVVATGLRRRFAVPDGEFRAILVGNDGGEKLTSREPIAAERLFSEIDAMPMRRSEMERRRP